MDKLTILLIGNGAREHALAHKLSASERVNIIYAVPGNGGTSGEAKVQNVNNIKADDLSALTALAKEKDVNLVVPGPEGPLVAGISDVCTAGTTQPCFYSRCAC